MEKRAAIIKGNQIDSILYNNLTELFLETTKEETEKGIVFVKLDNTECFISYSELREIVLQYLGGLKDKGIKAGDKLIIQFEDDMKFIIALWSCILGGILPVPLPIGINGSLDDLEKLINVKELLDNCKLLIEEKNHKYYSQKISNEDLIIYEEISPRKVSEEECYKANKEEIAIMQFSSGTTGTPKGVAMTHYNLIFNVVQTKDGLKLEECDISLSWLPFTHDFQLVGFHLASIYVGMQQVKMPPVLFIKKPNMWFEKISKHKATIIGSPNFGYKLMLSTLQSIKYEGIDLSSVRAIVNAGEPISAEISESFMKNFSRLGLKETAMLPCYGLAEATLAVTCSPLKENYLTHVLDRNAFSEFNRAEKAKNDKSISFIDEGYPFLGVEIKIADDLGETAEEGEIGNIFIKGPNVIKGYYKMPDLNKEVFKDGWFNTGDLGFILNGRLTVTGRKKDVIFVNGKNIYSFDIESLVYRNKLIENDIRIAICQILDDINASNKIVLFICKPQNDRFIDTENIRRKIAEVIGIYVDELILIDKLPLTASGKVQHFKLVNMYKNKEIDFLSQDISNKVENNIVEGIADLDEIEKLIRMSWSKVLNVDISNIGDNDTFIYLGGNSIKAMQLLNELENGLKTELGQDILIECKTIKDMVGYIENKILNKDSEKDTAIQNIKRHEDSSKKEDMAIVGIAGKFPESDNIDELWKNLANGVKFINNDNSGRWSIEGQAAKGGFLKDVDKFDSKFFGVSAIEAVHMDPQQRLFLEVVYQLFEDAGAFEQIKKDNRVGVYIGCGNNSYAELINSYIGSNGMQAVNQTTLVGNMLNMISARVSQYFNLKGPAITLDTACSSSIIALSLAINAIRNGECSMAVVGGVNLMNTPSMQILFSKTGALSSDSRCKVFDQSADGFVPCECIASILIKPLSKAIEDNDRIYGVIKGVAVNNDGHSLGLMAPNPKGQFEVLKSAYEDADVEPQKISYIEAHGTGTIIGDPIEIRSLNQFFRDYTGKQTIAVGSVKSDLGHAMSAAGMVGLIKVLLCMKNEKLLPIRGLKNENKQIDFKNTTLYPIRDLTKWDASRPLTAGVSSFGFGGTNAHMVVEEAPKKESFLNSNKGKYHIVTLSAKSKNALLDQTSELYQYLLENKELKIGDIAFTRNTCREELSFRRAVVANSTTDLIEILKEVCEGAKSKNIYESKCLKDIDDKIVFAFGGQGLQYLGMGEELYNSNSVFKEYVDKCAELFKKHMPQNIDIREVMFADKDNEEYSKILQKTVYCQPAIFTLEYALAKVWISYGVEPKAVIGHSLGEYVAACIADIISLEDGVRLVVARATLMQSIPNNGSMLLVFSEKEKIEKLVEKFGLEIGVINTKDNIVISGLMDSIKKLQEELQKEKIECRELVVSNAFHSRLMEPILDEFSKVLDTVKFSKPSISFVSNLTGKIENDIMCSSNYWVKQLRNTVLFMNGIQHLIANKYYNFIEIGPSKNLSSYIKILGEDNAKLVIVSSLNKYYKSEIESFMGAVASLWASGLKVQWKLFFSECSVNKIYLPLYPFEKIRHWISDKELIYNEIITENEGKSAGTFENQEEIEDEAINFEISLDNTDIENTVTSVVANLLDKRIDEVKKEENLLDLGIDSLSALRLVKRLSNVLNIELYPTIIFEYQTIKSLCDYLKDEISSRSACSNKVQINKVKKQESYSLSSAQKRLWVLYKKEPDNPNYNVPASATFEGKLDIEKLRKTINFLINRHGALRTVFIDADGIPKQKIMDKLEIEIPLVEVPGNAAENYIKSCIEEDIRKPFSLEKGPLVRCIIFKLNDNLHRVYVNMHHIITDGWSMGLFVREVSHVYDCFKNSRDVALPDLDINYIDYAYWYNKEIDNDEYLKAQEEYWLKEMGGNIPLVQLPSDVSKCGDSIFNGAIRNCVIESDKVKQIQKITKRYNCSMYAILFECYLELLYALSGEKDIVVGIPSANRTVETLENVMGFFVNTLCIRQFIDSSNSHIELISKVMNKITDAVANQDYPYERLVDRLGIKRGSMNQLFSTMFAMQNFMMSYKFENMNVKLDNLVSVTSKYDLLVNIMENNGDLSVNFEYNTDKFSETMVDKFIDKYNIILEQILENENQIISETNVITENELNFLNDFNNTDTDYSIDKPINEMFVEQAIKTPKEVALVYKSQKVTYEELNLISNKVARLLRKLGSKQDALIGIMVSKSIEMISGTVGILKSGAAYVPVDPGYPEKRILYMLENSGIEIVITQKKYFDIMNKICQQTKRNMNIILIDEDSESEAWQQLGKIYTRKDINEMPCTDLKCINSVSGLVYILYTSGSTGKPKGVMMHHKAVANLMEWEIRRYGIGLGDKQIQFASLSFDVSFQEIFSSLLSGATLYLIDDEEKIPETIANMTEKEKITVLSFPTSFFNQMAIYLAENAGNYKFENLKYIFVAGEAMSGKSVKDWQSAFGTKHTIINAYGPTEAHVVTYHDINYKIGNDVNVVTIGKPISNVQIYILDESNKLLGNGSIGELCIGGYNVARGYLNNEEKTKQVFIPDSIGNKGGTIYKTGDLARIGSDGNIEYLGRRDHQVKIRGFRVELGELENIISEYDKVDEVVVVVREDSNSVKRLVAFITSKEKVNIGELKKFVAGKVPGYMVPAVFMQLEKMPLTPNRKIDRLNLPSVKFADLIDKSQVIMPQTEKEIKVAQIWCEVLKLDSVGVNQDFFEIGGDSLVIMQVMAKLKAQYSKLDVKELFNNTTIQEICQVLEKCELEEKQQEETTSKEEAISSEECCIKEAACTDYTNEEEMHNAFVTGVTGYLGGYITWQLLNNTHFQIYCLARGDNQENAKERVYKNLEYLFEERWTNSNYKDRIIVKNGSLEKEYFGLDIGEYNNLVSQIDVVYHAAANVKHYSDDESKLIESNVTATNNVIAFCSEHKIKPFNYVSTVGVAGLMSNRKDKTFRETDFFEDAVLPNIYEKTKYEAEKIVRKYMFKGYPVRIFRTGFLMGDSTNGKFKKDIHVDAMYRFIKAAIQMGIAPNAKNDLVEFVPVDFASKAIVMLSLNKKCIGKTLHICNPNQVSRNQLWSYLKDIGYNIYVMDSVWYKENVYNFRNDDDYIRGLQNIIVYLDDFYSTEVIYNSDIAQEHLKEIGLACPRIDKNIIETYINYCIKVNYLQKPSDIDYSILTGKIEQQKRNIVML